MKITSQLSEKCRKCPRFNTCNEKRAEACAYAKMPDLCMADAMAPTADYAHNEVLVKHDYRDIKIGPNATVSLDIEEAKKQLEQDIYKALGGPCLEFGA